MDNVCQFIISTTSVAQFRMYEYYWVGHKVHLGFSVTSFVKKLLIFNWRIVALQYCVGFCHTSTWISQRYIYVSFLLNLPPSSQPMPSHPSGLSQSTSLSSLHHTANCHWLSASHMVMYMFPYYSVSSSHPLFPPLLDLTFEVCPWPCSKLPEFTLLREPACLTMVSAAK